MSQPTAQYADTKWKEYSNIEMEIDEQEIGEMTGLRASFPDDSQITYNYAYLTKSERNSLKPKCFIVDLDDFVWIAMNESQHLDFLFSCSDFLKHRPKKRIYIRYFRDLGNGEEVSRILVEDVLEIIPLVLKQQKTPIDPSDDRLTKLLESWNARNRNSSNMFEGNDKRMYNTMDMEEFKQTLEAFDINKKLITVVPDILYEDTRLEHNLVDHRYATAHSPHGQTMMYPSCAVFQFFQIFIHRKKWYKDYCSEHCKNHFHHIVLDAMNKYALMDQTVFVSFEHVNTEVRHLVEHCTYKHQKKDLVKLNIFKDLKNSDMISISSYMKFCRNHQLSVHIDFLRDKHKLEDTIPVWRAQIYFMIGQMQSFVPFHLKALTTVFKTAWTSRLPDELLNQMKDVMNDIFYAGEFVTDSEAEFITDSEEEESEESGEESAKHRFEKMRDNAERRKQELQKKKDAKKNKGGKVNSNAKKPKSTKGVKNIPVQKSDDVATSSQMMAREMTTKLLEGTESLSQEELIKKLEGVEVSLHFEKPESVDDSKVTVFSSSEVMDEQKVNSLNRGIESSIAKLEEIKIANNEEKDERTDQSNPPENAYRSQLEKSESKINSRKITEIMEGSNTKYASKNNKVETASKPMDEINSSKRSNSGFKKQSERKSMSPETKRKEEKRNNSKTRKEDSVTTSNESKCCSKCLRTSEMCNEAKKELKTTQNKLKAIEDKARKTDQLEKKMKEIVKENQQLKIKNSERDQELKTFKEKAERTENKIKEMEKEMEQLKRQVQEMEAMKTRKNEAEEKLRELETDRNDLKNAMAQLKQQTQKSGHVEQLEKDLLEKDIIISELRETNMRVTVRNEEQARNIQNLLDRLMASSSSW